MLQMTNLLTMPQLAEVVSVLLQIVDHEGGKQTTDEPTDHAQSDSK